MATTTGSTFPMRPAGGYGSANAAHGTVLPLDPSISVRDGDIMVIDTGTRDMQVIAEQTPTGAAAGNMVLGVAQVIKPSGGEISANATIDRDGTNVSKDGGSVDTMNVALAVPGARFEANLIGGTTGSEADHTGVYATDIRGDLTAALDCFESSDGYACVGITNVNDLVFVMEYVSPQADTQGAVGSVGQMFFGREAGVGLTNPRVNFFFRVSKTVFG